MHASSPAITDDDQRFILEAARFFDHPPPLVELVGSMGQALERRARFIPPVVRRQIERATEAALTRAVRAATRLAATTTATKPASTLQTNPTSDAAPPSAHPQPFERALHNGITGISGALTGMAGATLVLVDLPLTTTVILHGIARAAARHGEDLSAPETQLECLKVFALAGGRHELEASAGTGGASARGMETGYYAARLAAAAFKPGAVLGGTAAHTAAFIRFVAQRFGVRVVEKVALQWVPLIGAVTGAAVNVAFTDYFIHAGHYHFGLRALERRYGTATVQVAFEALSG